MKKLIFFVIAAQCLPLVAKDSPPLWPAGVTLSVCCINSLAPSCVWPPAESERSQRLPEMDVAQQLKLRERQRFFEEVFQHDVDVYLSSAHLCIRDYKRRRWFVLLVCLFVFYLCSILPFCSPPLQLRSAASRPWRWTWTCWTRWSSWTCQIRRRWMSSSAPEATRVCWPLRCQVWGSLTGFHSGLVWSSKSSSVSLGPFVTKPRLTSPKW